MWLEGSVVRAVREGIIIRPMASIHPPKPPLCLNQSITDTRRTRTCQSTDAEADAGGCAPRLLLPPAKSSAPRVLLLHLARRHPRAWLVGWILVTCSRRAQRAAVVVGYGGPPHWHLDEETAGLMRRGPPHSLACVSTERRSAAAPLLLCCCCCCCCCCC